MQTISISYGKETLSLNLPDNLPADIILPVPSTSGKG